jgi:uncharacterized membrane protein YphA (DoxX/SURF4 family)
METVANDSRAAFGKGRLITIWILSVLAALAFLAAGGSKLAGAAPMVAVFDKVGIGQWFRYLTGLLEVVGAIGLFIPRTAVLLSLVMVGATIAHVTVLGGPPVAPIVLLILTGSIAYLRKP